MIAVNLRIHDDKLWRKFREIAGSRYTSANSMINQLIEEAVRASSSNQKSSQKR